jgi:hypothetical protein
VRIAVRQEQDIALFQADRRMAGAINHALAAGHDMEIRPTCLRHIVRRDPVAAETTKFLELGANAEQRR